MELRVAVYNVRGFRDDAAAAVRILDGTRPDLALIQEAGAGARLRAVAAALGMEAVHGPLPPFLRLPRNAVLVRPPWRVVERRVHRFDRSERFHPRGVTCVRVGRSGVRLWALSAHLGLVAAERRRHAEELTDLVASLPGPAVVGADLNEAPDRPAARWIGDRLFDAWAAGGDDGGGETFPASGPTARIDYLFSTGEIRVERARVLDGPDVTRASDHRPVVVDVRAVD
ncbi:MAG: endonuclease/exonuclease/phosphatase family protein [Actinobacteria bacterium]|nr:endonuclease/exonuclease/phosphatase family protein [Actinomycetota bacterium]